MKYCEACGQELEDNVSFCTTCGERQPQNQETPTNTDIPAQNVAVQMEQPMQNVPVQMGQSMQNVPVQMSINQNEYVQEAPAKKNKKKIIIPIVSVIVLALIGVGVYFIFFGSDEKKAEQGKGIIVNGEFYEFTAEEGIKDYNDIQGGVVKMISSDNWSGFSFKPDSGGDAIIIDQKDTVTWVYSDLYDISREDEIAYAQFYFRDGYSIDGLDGSATAEDMKEVGYISYYDEGSCFTYATEEGNVDWDVYREDYEKVMEAESFKCLPYYETLASLSGIGAEEIQVDDWEGYCDNFGTMMKYEQDTFTMSILCRADLEHKLKNGDIEMFMRKSFTLVPEGSDADHLLRISMFAYEDDVEKWYESWKEY